MNRSTKALSAHIRNYGHVLAVIFFPTSALSVEWIRFLISFIDPDGMGQKDSIGQAGFTGLIALVKYAALFFEV